MNEIFETAVQLAKEAGDITLKYFQSNVNVETKDDQSPVTIADKSAEEYIRAQIHQRFSDDGIVGEEHGVEVSKSGRRWIIDPIDGTQSFIRDVPLYGTLIAVEYDDAIQVGVMRFPALDITIAAQTGKGCFRNGVPCKVSSNSTIETAAVMTTSYPDLVKYQGVDSVNRLLQFTMIQRTWGDCYGYNLLAAGKVEAMIDPVVKLWDYAPLIPIIHEAGGKITDIQGNVSNEMTSVIASNGLFHDQLVGLFQ
jgi:histidinol phosphatase-like enzyme (inositol monophosphatase family)